jgi:hypothetical protein
VKADCSLFVSDEEWERVQSEKHEKRLEIAQLKARLAQSEFELLEAEARERSFARRDLAVLKELERAKEQVEGNSSPGTAAVEPPLSEPSADLGWLQADSSSDFLSFVDPLLDSSLSDFLDRSPGLDFPALDAAGGIPSPVPCSS